MPSEEADDDLEISRTRPAPCPSLRGVGEFQTDSGQCIQEATTKYEVSERIYRRCMRAQGWSASRHTIQAIASSGVRRMRTNSCRHQSPQRAGTKPSGPPGRPVLQGHDGIAAAALPAVTI